MATGMGAAALAMLLAGCNLLGGPRAPRAPAGFVSSLLVREEASGLRPAMLFDAGTLFVAYLQAVKSGASGGQVYRLFVASRAGTGSWAIIDTGEELSTGEPDKAFMVGPNGGLHLLLQTAFGSLVHLNKPPGGDWERTVVAEEGGRGPSLLWGTDGRLHGMWHSPDFSKLHEGTWRPGELWAVETIFTGKPATGRERADTVMLYDRVGTMHAGFVIDMRPGGRKIRHATRVPGGRWRQEPVSSRGRVKFGGYMQVTPDGVVHFLATETDAMLKHAYMLASGKWEWEILNRAVNSPMGSRLLQRPDGTLVAVAITGNLLYIAELPLRGEWAIRSLELGGTAGAERPAAALDDNGYLHLVVCLAPEGKPPSRCVPAYLGQVER